MKRKDILAILIPSFIFVIAWIILSVHHNIATSTISESVNVQIAPISSTFNTDIITALKTRQNITPSYEINIPVQNIVIPSASPTAIITLTPTPTPISSPVAIPTNTINATPGGTITQ
jgi:hypothetical protein